jgi:hypothetical protein
MIILGLILLVLGIVLAFHLLFILGLILLIVGLVLAVAGGTGHEFGPRRHYW